MAERRSGDLRSGGCGSVGDRPQLVETGHNWWRPATNWWRPATNWWRPATTGGGRPQLVEAGDNWRRLRYQPDNPLSNKDGYLFSSNVNSIEEMTNMISANRSFATNIEA